MPSLGFFGATPDPCDDDGTSRLRSEAIGFLTGTTESPAGFFDPRAIKSPGGG